MALYLGNSKRRIVLDNDIHYLNLYSTTPIVNGDILISSDGHILQDFKCLYITPEEDLALGGLPMLSIDGYILTDTDGLYLIIKESE